MGKVDKRWLQEHRNDPYVRLARERNYRSRAAFKLIGIDDEDRLIRPRMQIVELGSAPGSWSQVLAERLGRANATGQLNGRVIALDLLTMEAVAGVEFLQGDFRETATLETLEGMLAGAPVDLVVSDMAPNLSGVAVVDAARMQDLAELSIEFASRWLKADGALLMKSFHGSGYSQVVHLLKKHFVTVATRKPKASRDRSTEVYLLSRGSRLAQRKGADESI